MMLIASDFIEIFIYLCNTSVYTMDIHKIIRKPKEEQRTVLVTIRITPEMSRWLKSKNYSPSSIFNEAVKDLGFKGGNYEK